MKVCCENENNIYIYWLFQYIVEKGHFASGLDTENSCLKVAWEPVAAIPLLQFVRLISSTVSEYR